MAEIAIGKDQVLWIKEESSLGTPTWPTANDAVLLTGDGVFRQERAFVEDEQKRLTLSKLGRVAGPYRPGEFTIPTYIKPSGSRGVAPVPAALLKGLFGKENVVSGTKVEYILAGIDDDMPSFTMAFKYGHMVFYNFGCLVNQGSFPIRAGTGADSIVGATFSGYFLKQAYAGIDALSSAIDGTSTPVTTIPVKNAKKFTANSRIVIGDDDNSGEGYLVTAVDYDNNTLTITPGCNTAQATDAVVKGWTPSVVEAGVLVHGRFGILQESLDGNNWVDTYITEATIEINNNIKILEDEKTGDAYPRSYVRATEREVTLNISGYFRKDASQYFYEAAAQIARQIKLPAGDEAGKRLRFEMPNVQLDTPTLSGAEEIIVARVAHPFGTASMDDEVKLIFD